MKRIEWFFCGGITLIFWIAQACGGDAASGNNGGTGGYGKSNDATAEADAGDGSADDDNGVHATCKGDFVIENESDMDRISDCSVITGNLTISGTSLTSLRGLKNLTSVGHDLFIMDNNNLTSLDGLENLTSVRGSLGVRRNSSLTSINALWNVRVSPGIDLYITGNAELCTSLVDAFVNRLVTKCNWEGENHNGSNKDC